MKLKVIGSGSSGNCYLLECNNECLIMDAGIPIKDIKAGLDYDLSKVVGAIVTHNHQDHSKSLKDIRNMGIKVLTPFESENLWQKSTFGKFQIQSFDVPHNGEKNAGFLIIIGTQKILYITDFEYCPYCFAKTKVNHILVECNYQDDYLDKDLPNFEHKVRGHCGLETCKEFIEQNKTSSLRTIILLHLGEGIREPKQIVSEIKKLVDFDVLVDYARAGLEIDLRETDCPF